MLTLLLIALAGLAAQLVDGGLGMGFGATSTTLLVTLAGLAPVAASAVVHTAEVGTTFVSGVSHWRFGNVDWKVVARIGIPGAVGAFLGATVLSNLSTQATQPIMAIILTLIGLNLVWRFSRGTNARQVEYRGHSTGFLGGLGFAGGFIDATGGGGWGPVTTTTLLSLNRIEPRRIIGTVNTAEFLVSVAAVSGFVVGLWEDLLANLPAVLAILAGGAVAAPIGAWLISRVRPMLLGGFVGALLFALNAPKVLVGLGLNADVVRAMSGSGFLLCVAAASIGARRTRAAEPRDAVVYIAEDEPAPVGSNA